MPPDNPLKSPIEQASHKLREGIEASREIVRKSRVLIELSEANRPAPADIDDTRTATNRPAA